MNSNLLAKMKSSRIITLLILACASGSASAALDRNYYVADTAVKQRIDVFNDGKNTYIQAVSGLSVRGATVDDSRFILTGIPNEIPALFNGRAITITRGTAPTPVAPSRLPANADSEAINARINQLTAAIERLSTDKSRGQAVEPEQMWEIKSGDFIVETISRWTKDKWQVVSSVTDESSNIDITQRGIPLEDAIGKIMDGLNRSGTNWGAIFYPEVKVLRIVEKK